MITRAPLIKPSPSERLVSVRLALLKELQLHQHELDSYVRGYIASREQVIRCERIRSRLELATREPARLQDTLYWEGVRDWLDGISPLTFILPAAFASDFGDSIHAFDEALQEAKAQVSAAMRPAQEGDLKAFVTTVHRCVDHMRNAADSIAVRCREKADETLDRVRTCIALIFERIEAVPREPGGEPIERPIGYGVKVQREEIESQKRFLGTIAGETSSPGVKIFHK
ncbi:MAG: hypothetical protein D6759_14410 [Chloroflexi bacterium]|nr:MAG: hypothetical protein D6759_14410 [Chloroflexota bacterium]